MKLNELLEKLASDYGQSALVHETRDFHLVLKSPQGLEFLEAVYNRGFVDGDKYLLSREESWKNIKSEIEGEG